MIFTRKGVWMLRLYPEPYWIFVATHRWDYA